jgi:hypothetical protein
MSDAGAPAEAIALAVEAIEARDNVEAARKAKRAAQKAKERASRDIEATVARHGSDTEATVAPIADQNSSMISKEIRKQKPEPRVCAPTPVLYGAEEVIIPLTNATHSVPQVETPTQPTAIRKPTPRQELSEALGDELAAEVIDHRQRMRKPLTPQAAARLANEFVATGMPQDAARMMIDRGWQGFRLDWFKNATFPPARAGPLNGHSAKPSTSSILRDIIDGKRHEQPDDSFDFGQTSGSAGPTIEGSVVEVLPRDGADRNRV